MHNVREVGLSSSQLPPLALEAPANVTKNSLIHRLSCSRPGVGSTSTPMAFSNVPDTTAACGITQMPRALLPPHLYQGLRHSHRKPLVLH